MNKKRVVLGMSGGVDSSVAAYILKEQGYEVIGVTMQIWPDQEGDTVGRQGGCCSLSAVDDARRVANQLDIPYYVMNLKGKFEENVIQYFVDEYLAGRTPNPCIACNKYIKFTEFLRKAQALEAFYIATGHYARIVYDGHLKRFLLKKSATKEKDQTYVLYSMTQYQLEHTLMPLGDYTKDQVRRIAEDIGLSVAKKPDSQEICFVHDNDYVGFIRKMAAEKVKPGHFVDTDGNVLGRHEGVINYTIGQRKGLGIAFGKPVYVVGIDSENDIVILGEEHELFAREMIVENPNFISIDGLKEPMDVTVKIRYSAKEAPAEIIPFKNGKIKVLFKEAQRAVTPGQSAVFYDGDVVIGGGIICLGR